MNTRIHALATDRYGDLSRLSIIELPLPKPASGEVRVRVRATALNPADYKVIKGQVKFLHARNFPLVLGYDFSGTVEAIGSSVSQVAPGDDVFGFLAYGPTNRRGAFAEALIARVGRIALKPPGISHSQAAAAATTGVTALQALRDLGRLGQPGRQVLVTGVSGGVGSIAIGIAKRLGARVTALGSAHGLEIAIQLGAERTIDRTREDPIGPSAGRYDVVFDAAAAFRWRQWRKHLNCGGTYVTTLPSLAFVVDKLSSLVAGTRCALVTVKSKPADLRILGEWLTGGLPVPVARTIPLVEVPETLAQLARGEMQGRVVVEMDTIGRAASGS
ncbi:MAG TPA: NAD(P)-dependent alcohol dehydrogenase [Bryobacteraceae bacterium]|nr:NAD(P)-dependent alcohol dehydrogenase [Bryobacteraceae bacterium]